MTQHRWKPLAPTGRKGTISVQRCKLCGQTRRYVREEKHRRTVIEWAVLGWRQARGPELRERVRCAGAPEIHETPLRTQLAAKIDEWAPLRSAFDDALVDVPVTRAELLALDAKIDALSARLDKAIKHTADGLEQANGRIAQIDMRTRGLARC